MFDEHHAVLFRFAWRLTCSIPDAEDIVQESFLGLLLPTCSYDPQRASLRTWLLGVVRNHSLKRLRKNDVTPEGQCHTLTPEVEILRTELKAVVARAVLQLPDTQREVLILAHYEQMPLADIALVMDLDVGAVKSRLQRARAALKEMLAAYAPAQERKV